MIELLDKDITPIWLIDPRFSFQEFACSACRRLGLGPSHSVAESSSENEVGSRACQHADFGIQAAGASCIAYPIGGPGAQTGAHHVPFR